MFYTYVLKSITHEYYYKGHCEDINKRLKEHNSGFTKSIKKYRPFVLVYFEEFLTREEAIRRERYFKTGAGRAFVKYKIAVVQSPQLPSGKDSQE